MDLRIIFKILFWILAIGIPAAFIIGIIDGWLARP